MGGVAEVEDAGVIEIGEERRSQDEGDCELQHCEDCSALWRWGEDCQGADTACYHQVRK